MEPFHQRNNRRIDHTKHEVYISFLLSRRVFQKTVFSFKFFKRCIDCFSSMSKMILTAGSNFLHRCKKILLGRVVMEKKHPYLLKHIVLKILKYPSCIYTYCYLNRHIFKWYIEKGAMSITSRRMNKCPTPKQRFSENSPLPRPTRWQINDKCPEAAGTLGSDWANITILYTVVIIYIWSLITCSVDMMATTITDKC